PPLDARPSVFWMTVAVTSSFSWLSTDLLSSPVCVTLATALSPFSSNWLLVLAPWNTVESLPAPFWMTVADALSARWRRSDRLLEPFCSTQPIELESPSLFVVGGGGPPWSK